MVNRFFHISLKVLAVLFCGWVYSSYAVVSVQAVVSSKIVGVGQPFDLTITIVSGEDVDIKTPLLPKDISPFVIQGTSQSSGAEFSFSMSGKSIKTLKRNISYTLVSEKEGQWTIGSVSVEVDGKVYKTEEIQVEVSKQAPSSPPPNSIFNHPLMPKMFQDEEENFFFPSHRRRFNLNMKGEFILKPDKPVQEVYLGQGMPVQWFLYKKRQSSFAMNIQPHENMQPENFWTEKVKDPSIAQFTETEEIKGQEYFRALAASYIFFPLQEGELKIDPLKLTVKSPFSGFFTRSRPVVLESEPIDVKVLPLPQQGQGQFTGAVGRFFVLSKVDRKQILKNDILSYKIRFEGNGNIRTIKLPPWPQDPNFKVYDILESGEFSPEKSYKEFEVLLSAKRAGSLKTPRLNWTTFDPDLKSYVNHELEPIEIEVQTEDSVKGEEQKFFDSTKKELIPKKEDALSSLPEVTSAYNKYKYLLWGLIYTVLAMMIFWKHRSFFTRKKKISWTLILNQTFEQAQKENTAGEYRKAGTLVLNLLDQVWLAVTGTGGRELNKLIEKCPPSLRKDLGLEVRSIVTDLEDLSFSKRSAENDPWNQEKVEKLMKRCRDTIEKILRYS